MNDRLEGSDRQCVPADGSHMHCHSVLQQVRNEHNNCPLILEKHLDFDLLAYSDIFEIDGIQHKGQRNRKTSEVLIPYTNEPQVDIGDTIIQRTGTSTIELKVIDIEFLPGGTLNAGTDHPHMLTLGVENMTSAKHQSSTTPTSIHIASLTGQQVQVGNNNSQTTNITITEIVKQVAASQDIEAKSALRKLLENNTVAAIVGAGATTLLGILST
jgi:hypothetical protein